jgi:transposase-like protein
MSPTLGVQGRGNEAVVREAKASFLACWSAMAGSIPRSWSRSRRGAPLMTHIENHTRKGSVYYTDAFRGYQSLQRFGKHLVVNHSKEFVNQRTKNHINGIEEFWSYAKHILYNYRGVSRYHFPMYLKEIEYRYNHRKENVFKLFLQLCFGYVSPYNYLN